MKWFKIGRALLQLITIGERLYVFADPCDCRGRTNVQVKETQNGFWVRCRDCKLHGTEQPTKRLAKKAWNRIMREGC